MENLFVFYSDLSIDKKFRFNVDEITIINVIHRNCYKSFRKASTAYVNRVYVRKYILEKFNNQCNICGSKNRLEIDHIKSVKSCFISGHFVSCNTLENLRLLCKVCNYKKGSQ